METVSSHVRRISVLVALVASAMLQTDAFAASATRTSSFEYDPASGLLTKEVVEPDDSNLCLVTAYAYDAFGNKTSVTTRNCNGGGGEAAAPTGLAVFASRTTTNAYDSLGRFPTTTTNALNQSETKLYDPNFGVMTRLTGPNALSTDWNFDGFGRKTLETRADGTRTKYEYVLCSGVGGGTASCPALAKYFVQTTPLAADGVTQIGPWTRNYFDALNREIRSETQGYDGGGAPQVITKDTQYDNVGRIYRTSRPYFAGATAYWTTFSYDAIGRVVTVTQPDNSATAYSYSGLTTVAANALNQTQTKTRNSQGQVVQVRDAQNNAINYAFDPFGNLTTTTDPLGNTTTLTYDLRGRKIQMVDPDMGTWTYAYNAVGELVRQTDAKNQVTTMSYDQLGRMVSRAEPDLISNWYFDSRQGGASCPMGIGKLCQATTSTGYNRVHYYDSLGRPSETNTTIDTTYVDRTTYDAAGRIATRVYPGGFTAKYVYTALGYLKELRNGVTDALYWRANTLDPEARISQQEYGNGVITQHVFDAATGRLANIFAGPGNSVQNLALQYDSVGNVVSRQDATQNVTETFLYDNLNRLTSATVNSSAAGVVTTDYAYDVLGNLICKSDLGTCSGSAPNYTYQATAPLPGGGTRPLLHAVSYINANGGSGIGGAYQYDGNGNAVVFGNAYTIAYTSANLVSRISTSATADFWYGPERQRIRMYASWTGTRNVYYLHPDNQNGLFYEKAVTATTQYQTEHTYYLTAAGQTVAAVVQGDTGTSVRYFHRDHLGSLVAITDDTGTVIERFGYEPFGKRRYPDGTSDPTTTISSQYTYRGFTNHEHLSEVGLIHMNGRVFHPAIGRFMSADPYVQAADNLQSYNRYSYTFNNPLTYTDPSGYFNLFKSVQKAWKSVWHSEVGRVVIGIGVAAWLGYGDFTWLTGSVQGIAGANTLATAYMAGFWGGMVASGGDYRAALQGGLTAGLFWGVGEFVPGAGGSPIKVAAHAAAGCLSTMVGGGDCGSGALSAGFAEFVGPQIPGWGRVGNIARQAIIGGTAATLGGGKFGNGALTGAFGYLFNECAHNGCWVTDEERALFRAGRTVEGYRLMCQGGDSYACEAGKVAANQGLAANLTNARLETSLVTEGAARSRVEAQQLMGAIRIDLGNAYVDHLDSLGGTPTNPVWPSRRQIAEFHKDIFTGYGAANVFGGKISDLPIVRSIWGYDWCRNCRP